MTGFAKDHPRSRGVYGPRFPVAHRQSGSSPLARGLHDGDAQAVACSGIIPARAGFTGVSPRPADSSWDHPRSRGVYATKIKADGSNLGSSPLARGLRSLRSIPGIVDRIIPARAGFTVASSVDMDANAGSSPLARGLQTEVVGARRLVRIIPARAGFTDVASFKTLSPTDHPRSRGVYLLSSRCTATARGSSPLARGLHRSITPVVDSIGIIPARAGFTWTGAPRDPGRWDHPRSRGVYRRMIREGIIGGGSSPLARGLPRLQAHGR